MARPTVRHWNNNNPGELFHAELTLNSAGTHSFADEHPVAKMNVACRPPKFSVSFRRNTRRVVVCSR